MSTTSDVTLANRRTFLSQQGLALGAVALGGLLQRDARGLEKALQDAGLKTDMNSLAFQKGGGNAHDPEQGPEDRRRQATGTEQPQPEAQEAADRRSLHDGSLDISV